MMPLSPSSRYVLRRSDGHGLSIDRNSQAFLTSTPSLLRAWIQVPAGILVILLACFAVDGLLKLGKVSFPASVAVLILLFFGLLLLEWVIGSRKTGRIVAVIEIPVSIQFKSNARTSSYLLRRRTRLTKREGQLVFAVD